MCGPTSRSPAVSSTSKIRIVDSADVDDTAGDLEVGPHIGQILPSARHQLPGERRPVDRGTLRVAAGAEEIADRILEGRLVVVVVAGHEDAGAVEQRG